MSDVIIRAENLGKKYIIGHQRSQQGRYVALRDVLAHGAKSLVQRINPFKSSDGLASLSSDREEFWALKDVSFEVNRGDRVGIIGRNGAGKSTLLKILSRITEPTTGRVTIKGRVASLLEVGTGFHAELTGRENIYLNGTILGMSREEIKHKFDEIVAFAEVEKFLDTPVKHYSSGMYVRLAFAVAAHLEPEILIVDEVLAVGDAQFQKKCLGKMEEVGKEGRTVLFVSHNMTTISSLCSRILFLREGKLELDGESHNVIHKYLNENIQNKNCFSDLLSIKNRQGKGEIKFSNLELLNEKGEAVRYPYSGMELTIRLKFHLIEDKIFENCRVGVVLKNIEGVNIVLSSEMISKDEIFIKEGDFLDFIISKFPLTKSEYMITLFLENNGTIQDWLVDEVKISVEDGDYYGTGKSYPSGYEGKSTLIDFVMRKTSNA